MKSCPEISLLKATSNHSAGHTPNNWRDVISQLPKIAHSKTAKKSPNKSLSPLMTHIHISSCDKDFRLSRLQQTFCFDFFSAEIAASPISDLNRLTQNEKPEPLACVFANKSEQTEKKLKRNKKKLLAQRTIQFAVADRGNDAGSDSM